MANLCRMGRYAEVTKWPGQSPNVRTRRWAVRESLTFFAIGRRSFASGLASNHSPFFGSSARGHARKGSDIDFLVDFDRPVGFFTFCELEDFLSDVLGGADVDLVLRRAVIEDLKEAILGGAVDVIG